MSCIYPGPPEELGEGAAFIVQTLAVLLEMSPAVLRIYTATNVLPGMCE